MGCLRILSATATALFVTAFAHGADASPTFPPAIKSDLSLSYDLGTTHCVICHQTNSGGIGTVVHPFGLAMKAAGLHLEDLTSLQNALNTLDANKTDSDCDGTPDIEQIKMGRDPNPPGDYIDGSNMTAPADPGCMGGSQMLVPAYGCAAQLSRAPAAWPGAAVVVALLGGLAGRAGRRRRRAELRARPFIERRGATREPTPRASATADPVPVAW
jgi:hypothetical protein